MKWRTMQMCVMLTKLSPGVLKREDSVTDRNEIEGRAWQQYLLTRRPFSWFQPLVTLVLLACLLTSAPVIAAQSAKDATEATREVNSEFRKRLPFADRQDYEDASRGFIATFPGLTIKSDDGRTVWTLKGYDFLRRDEAPSTINPSLFRNAQLNMTNGLFKVTGRIYQIRGFDLSNMTIVEGDTGLIVIDPLISAEVAKAGLDLYYRHRPKKPVIAVIYSHSHVDHFGGVKGVVSEAEVRAGRVKIYAPEHFLEAAISENVYAGNAMSRRSPYQFGSLLPAERKDRWIAASERPPRLGPLP